MDVERSILLQNKAAAARVAREEETTDQREIRLEQQRIRSRSRKANETEEERQSRLSKDRERARSKRAAETKEQQDKRLTCNRERNQSTRRNQTEEESERRRNANNLRTQAARENEAEEDRQRRRNANNLRTQAARENETEEDRQHRRNANRLSAQAARTNETIEQSWQRKEKNKERTHVARQNENKEQRKKRLEQQKQRTQTNTRKNKVNNRGTSGSYAFLQSISSSSIASNQLERHGDNSDDSSNGNTNTTFTNWPEPVPGSLKNRLLKQFVRQMSMSTLAETSCAVCNIRTSVSKAKKLPIDKIPSLHLLEVPQDLKDLISKSHSPGSKASSITSDANVNTVRTGQNSSGNTFPIQFMSIRVNFISRIFKCEHALSVH